METNTSTNPDHASEPPSSVVSKHIHIVIGVTHHGDVDEVRFSQIIWAKIRAMLVGTRNALGSQIAPTGILASLTYVDILLLMSGLLLYSFTRLTGLAHFPIYFFSDEATQANIAQNLLQNGFRDSRGILFPPYFQNVEKWSLSLSVYIHTIGVALFGKSVEVTRATSVVVGLLAPVAVALTLKLIFNNRFWWAGVLVLAATPAWFLHSRTAFEPAIMVAFFACFICSYLLYRYRSPHWLAAALVFGAATFYSYTNGQGLMLATAVLLLLSDLRYHLSQRRIILQYLPFLLLLATPYLHFRILNPGAVVEHLRVLNSYWFQPLPLDEKLTLFAQNYLQGISPRYWFAPEPIDIVRHRMRGMGHILPFFFPFVLIGLAVCFAQLGSTAHRTVLIALLAAPFSSAVADLLVTRMLAMVIPVAILICLGFEQAAQWLQGRVRFGPLAIGVAILLTVISLSMTRAALVEGPTWYTDYRLYGMQYGAEQVFAAVAEELIESPETRVLVSPTWANNPGAFLDFFLNDGQRSRVQFDTINTYLTAQGDLSTTQLFVMTPEEYEQAQTSGMLVMQPPERVLFYPDSRPGFYFVRAEYVADVDRFFN